MMGALYLQQVLDLVLGHSQSPHLGSQWGTRRVWDFKITPLIADFGPEKDPLFHEKRDFLPLKVTPYLMKTTNITSNMK